MSFDKHRVNSSGPVKAVLCHTRSPRSLPTLSHRLGLWAWRSRIWSRCRVSSRRNCPCRMSLSLVRELLPRSSLPASPQVPSIWKADVPNHSPSPGRRRKPPRIGSNPGSLHRTKEWRDPCLEATPASAPDRHTNLARDLGNVIDPLNSRRRPHIQIP